MDNIMSKPLNPKEFEARLNAIVNNTFSAVIFHHTPEGPEVIFLGNTHPDTDPAEAEGIDLMGQGLLDIAYNLTTEELIQVAIAASPEFEAGVETNDLASMKVQGNA